MGTKSNRSSGTQKNPKGFTQGVTLICTKSGDPIDCIIDESGKRRLAVDASITLENLTVNVHLTSDDDAVRIEDPNTGAWIRVESDGSINVNTSLEASQDSVSIGAHSNQIFDEAEDTITTANSEEIYSFTSTNNNTRIVKLECTVSTPSKVSLKIDGSIKKIFRTSPMERNIIFKFDEHKTLSNGQILTIEAQVERKILTTYESFVALEGYIE